jgi:drug/metabolite transporter (DMT)-like permease
MRELVSIAVGIAVGLACLALWAFVLQIFGISVYSRMSEDRASKRERIKKMGKMRYIVSFGVLGFGLAVGLAITTADLLSHHFHGWSITFVKLLCISVLGGWFHGAWTWSTAFRDPVPYPPDYSALK